MLVVGTDDGVVRVWRNYRDQDHCSVVTTWRALPCQSESVNAGLIFDWQDTTSLVCLFLHSQPHRPIVNCRKLLLRAYVGCNARMYCARDTDSYKSCRHIFGFLVL